MGEWVLGTVLRVETYTFAGTWSKLRHKGECTNREKGGNGSCLSFKTYFGVNGFWRRRVAHCIF